MIRDSSRQPFDQESRKHVDRWPLAGGRWCRTLEQNWSLRPLEAFSQGLYTGHEHDWLPVNIPGHWQQISGLEQHAGRVVYRCRFTLEELKPLDTQQMDGLPVRYWLRFNGVFYWSQPYLNGLDLGRHEGYFIPHEHDITARLKPDNTLLVEVDCPDEHNKFGKRMITGVFSHWDCLDPHWNPGGIWLPVELVQSGPVRLQGVRCHTESFNERFAQLHYFVDLDTALPGPVTLRWSVIPHTFVGEPQVFEHRRTLRSGQQKIQGLLKLSDPRLWWTHDLGNPDLYTIRLEIIYAGTISDVHHFRFGIRQFELRNWIPHLNGVRFLVKGNNYAPGDMHIATMTAEQYAHDLNLVRQCHMNFLRVHAHVDHPAFYDMADQAGVLLWQDLPLQWLYRASVLPEARRQTQAMVHVLYNHPSVAIWCMHNEPFFVGDTNDETLVTRLRTYQTAIGFSWNRNVMDTELKRVAEHADPSRPVVRSSGEMQIPRLRVGTDSHAYFGWYQAYGTLRDAEMLRRRFPGNLRFVTEFGAQSFPNVASCIKFMPADINQIDFDYLAQRHGFQPEIMANWINWRAAGSLEELVAMSQDYQIFINRFYVDRLRYHKYRPTGGIVPFLFCDPYPAVLWSIVDYWRVPKRSYDALRLAFSPQYAFCLFEPRRYRVGESIQLPLYVVNDAHSPTEALGLAVWLRSPDGTELAHVEHTLTLDADCLAQEVDRLQLTPTQTGRYALELRLTGGAEDVWQVYEVEVT